MTQLSVARNVLSTLELAGRARAAGRTDDVDRLIEDALDMDPPEKVWSRLQMMPPNIHGAIHEAREHLNHLELSRLFERRDWP